MYLCYFFFDATAACPLLFVSLFQIMEPPPLDKKGCISTMALPLIRHDWSAWADFYGDYRHSAGIKQA